MITYTIYSIAGARAPDPASLRACDRALARIPPDARILVGDATGIDQRVRVARPDAQVFRRRDHGGSPSLRTIAHILAFEQECGDAGPGLHLAFPSRACPVGLMPDAQPGRCFCGLGSGTWAGLALVIGRGLSAVCYLPDGVIAPPGWPLIAHRGGWYSCNLQ